MHVPVPEPAAAAVPETDYSKKTRNAFDDRWRARVQRNGFGAAAANVMLMCIYRSIHC